MNIGTHFDYNHHIAFISTHSKIGTPHEKSPVLCKRSGFADSTFSNVAATFRQCLSPIVGKLTRQGLLVKHIQELSHGSVGSRRFTLVGGGLATINRLLTVSLVVEQL